MSSAHGLPGRLGGRHLLPTKTVWRRHLKGSHACVFLLLAGARPAIAQGSGEQRFTVHQLTGMLQSGVSPTRAVYLISGGCVVGGVSLASADEGRLRQAGATIEVLNTIRRFSCAQGPAASVPAASGSAVLGVGLRTEQFTVIPAGAFQMGSSNRESDERPTRTVAISRAFLMQRTEVTQAQWRQVMRGTVLENQSSFQTCGHTCPVGGVSWNDIQRFLERLNQQDPGKNYRLPTEAEWEYAARAGTTGDYGGNGLLNDMGWWAGNSGDQPHPSAQKLENAWGLHDMHGNVFEWVNDWYSATYYREGPNVDPPGPASGSSRVLRSGTWLRTASYARSAYRISDAPSIRKGHVGFRLVRER